MRWRTVLPVVLLALLLAPGPAAAQQDGGWTITSYDVRLQVDDDATMQVVERIEVDFGSLQRRGIFRYIPVWEDLPTPLPESHADALPEGADPADFHRILEIDDLEVTSESGAPTELDVQGPDEANGNVQVRIGDPETTITGRQQYEIRYTVRGALEPVDGGAALAWDAVGTGWPVPIQQVTVTLDAPGVASARCLQGAEYATDQCQASVEDPGARYVSTGTLAPNEGLTVAAQFDAAALDAPQILVDEKPSLRRALIGSGAAIPLAVAVLVLGAGLLVWLGWRQGRDRAHVGGVTSHGTIDERRVVDRRRGLFEPRPVPVEFRPPDGLRPGQLGLIVDERVDEVDVTATLVDLAVRGYLTIEEVESSGWLRKGDWRLTRTEPDDGAGVDDLLGFERLLLDGLFEGRDSVLVSDLKGTFARDYERVETALYADGQSRRWFADRPDHVRTRWLGTGAATAVFGVVAAVVLGLQFRIGLVGLAVTLLGLGLMAAHRLMPRRTARGSALLTRTLGFREFIETAETDRMEFAEREQVFVDYLPYAVVFGCIERWAKVFEDLGVDVGSAVSGFYVGPGTFHLMAFSAGMHDFSSSVGSAVVAAPPSSGGGGGFAGGGFGGGGFSGGGMGGGGGGSW